MAEITKDGATGTTLVNIWTLCARSIWTSMMAGILTRNLPTGLLLLHGVKHWQIWMRVIGAYHAADPNAAIGRALENIAEFAGIKRRAASFSTTVAQFGGMV